LTQLPPRGYALTGRCTASLGSGLPCAPRIYESPLTTTGCRSVLRDDTPSWKITLLETRQSLGRDQVLLQSLQIGVFEQSVRDIGGS